MSNIDKRAELRKELSNPAIGSNAHLRKLALALLDELEAKDRKILKLEKLAEAESVGADKAAASGIEWMKRCLAAEKRIAEMEAREVRLTDINEYLAEVHDKTLNRAFRLLAEGVRAGDVAAMRAAGINVSAAGKGEAS